MPKFYINIQKAGMVAPDDAGQDLPSLEAARAAAMKSAREM
jgi:hypothetical protein